MGRSVLESKERVELQAIAEQLSVKTNSRMKKADLIDGILSAAGVGEDSSATSSEKPARKAPAPRAKAPETPAEEGGDAEESASASDDRSGDQGGDQGGNQGRRACGEMTPDHGGFLQKISGR